MNIDDLVAIDVHTHAEVSCRQPGTDPYWEPFETAASKYFKVGKRPTIAETIAYYREKRIGLVMFTVDAEFQIGNRRIANDEIAEAAAANADIMIAFASIDPHKGIMGVREARELIEGGIVKGFKFHPTCQGFFPNDRMAYKLYEVIAEHKLPAIFHTGHSGMGTGLRGGGGLAAQILAADPCRRRRRGFPRHDDHPRASVLAMDGRGAVDRAAQAERLHRPQRLDAEIFSAADRAIRQHAIAREDAVRLGFPAHQPRPLDRRFRKGGVQAGSAAADPEGKRDPRAGTALRQERAPRRSPATRRGQTPGPFGPGRRAVNYIALCFDLDDASIASCGCDDA